MGVDEVQDIMHKQGLNVNLSSLDDTAFITTVNTALHETTMLNEKGDSIRSTTTSIGTLSVLFRPPLRESSTFVLETRGYLFLRYRNRNETYAIA